MSRAGFIYTLLILLSGGTSLAGEAGLAFLKIAAGARAAGMGEAFVAAADDALSPFWNPAGSAWMERGQAHLTHNAWIQDVNHEAASVVLPASFGAFGVGVIFNNVENIERREIASAEPLATFSAHDYSFALSAARKISENVSVGVNAKFIGEKIYIESANGYAFDLGARVRLNGERLFAGAALHNIGRLSKMAQERLGLPLLGRVGVLWRPPVSPRGGDWRVSIDLLHVSGESNHLHVGSEIQPVPLLWLRAGYQSGYEERGVSAGFGLRWNVLGLDYAYVPFQNDLGNSHRFSFLISL